jgi:hypothetical protein
MPALQNAGNQVGEMTDCRLDRMAKSLVRHLFDGSGFHIPGRLASTSFARNCGRRYVKVFAECITAWFAPQATAGYRGPVGNGRLRYKTILV